jgi:hypothetical protein
VQHRTHFIRGKVQVGLAIVADHVPMAVAVSLDHAFDFVEQSGGALF